MIQKPTGNLSAGDAVEAALAAAKAGDYNRLSMLVSAIENKMLELDTDKITNDVMVQIPEAT